MTLIHQFEALLTRVCVRLLLRGGRPLSQRIQRSVRRPCCPFAFQSFLDGRRFLRTPGQGLGTLTDGFSTLAYFRGLKKKKKSSPEFEENRRESVRSDSTAVRLVARPSRLERRSASVRGPRGFLL